jgi:hypothetical protein
MTFKKISEGEEFDRAAVRRRGIILCAEYLVKIIDAPDSGASGSSSSNDPFHQIRHLRQMHNISIRDIFAAGLSISSEADQANGVGGPAATARTEQTNDHCE